MGNVTSHTGHRTASGLLGSTVCDGGESGTVDGGHGGTLPDDVAAMAGHCLDSWSHHRCSVVQQWPGQTTTPLEEHAFHMSSVSHEHARCSIIGASQGHHRGIETHTEEERGGRPRSQLEKRNREPVVAGDGAPVAAVGRDLAGGGAAVGVATLPDQRRRRESHGIQRRLDCPHAEVQQKQHRQRRRPGLMPHRRERLLL